MIGGSQIDEWARWLFGGIAALAIGVWRHMSKKHEDTKVSTEAAHRRIDHIEARVDGLEIHIENGSKERAEIKHAIERLDDKIDTLIERTVSQ